jgi:hypothetical protein
LKKIIKYLANRFNEKEWTISSMGEFLFKDDFNETDA